MPGGMSDRMPDGIDRIDRICQKYISDRFPDNCLNMGEIEYQLVGITLRMCFF